MFINIINEKLISNISVKSDYLTIPQYDVKLLFIKYLENVIFQTILETMLIKRIFFKYILCFFQYQVVNFLRFLSTQRYEFFIRSLKVSMDTFLKYLHSFSNHCFYQLFENVF